MKKVLLFISFVLFTNINFAQTEFKATMGVNFISVASMQDYVNQTYAPYDAQLNTFNAAVIFSVEGGYFLNSKFEMGVEIPYQIYSYTTFEKSGAGQYNLSYDELMPSVMAYYVLSGTGYNFKFGGGVGPRFVFVTEEKKWLGTSESYSSIGFGALLRIEANTSLAENVFANVGFDLRYDVNGEPEDNSGGKLEYNYQGIQTVNFNTFSAGVKLGISFLIGGSN